MGQIARQNAAARFIAEFRSDYVHRCEFRVGQTLTVTGVHLACREGSEQVVLCVRLADATLDETVLETGAVLFDPLHDDNDDLLDRLMTDFDLTRKQVRTRLERAGLWH